MEFVEMKTLTEQSNRLTTADINQIQNEINLPVALCEDITDANSFLFALKDGTNIIPSISIKRYITLNLN